MAYTIFTVMRFYSYFLTVSAFLFISMLSACDSNGKQALQHELAALRSDIAILQQQVQSLKSDFSTLKLSSEADDSSNAPIFPLSWIPDGSHLDDAFLGPKEAPLIVMGFNDYQCAPCRQFARDTLPHLKQSFIEKKELRFIIRDFPLSKHPQAVPAATFAHCAGEQGLYWEAFELLFAHAALLEEGRFSDLSEKIGQAKQDKLKDCLESGRYKKEINDDIREGKSLGIKGAPGFFVGRALGDGSYKGVFVRGAQPYAVFEQELEKLLDSGRS